MHQGGGDNASHQQQQVMLLQCDAASSLSPGPFSYRVPLDTDGRLWLVSIIVTCCICCSTVIN